MYLYSISFYFILIVYSSLVYSKRDSYFINISQESCIRNLHPLSCCSRASQMLKLFHKFGFYNTIFKVMIIRTVYINFFNAGKTFIIVIQTLSANSQIFNWLIKIFWCISPIPKIFLFGTIIARIKSRAINLHIKSKLWSI